MLPRSLPQIITMSSSRDRRQYMIHRRAVERESAAVLRDVLEQHPPQDHQVFPEADIEAENLDVGLLRRQQGGGLGGREGLSQC